MATKTPPRDRLAHAAFQLFQERGYEQTTIEDIAERAGLGRATFFRHYRSKDDVIFPDHDLLLARVKDRLDSSNQQTALAAVSDAVRLVLLHYVSEGDVAKVRYGLTSKVATLRDREIATAAHYQRMFRDFIAGWMGDEPDTPLRAELMSAAVVAAHNHVLRRWLRGASTDPSGDVDRAMSQVMDLFPASADIAVASKGTVVVAFRADRSLDEVLPELRDILGSAAR